MAKSPFWMAVSRLFPFEAKKGIKRQRKAFLVLELNWLAVKFKVTFSPKVSCALSSVSLLHRALWFPFGPSFSSDRAFFNKRGKTLSLVPLPSFHGFSSLKWLTQHHCVHQPLPKHRFVLLWHFHDLKSQARQSSVWLRGKPLHSTCDKDRSPCMPSL